jgi:UDP-N-acetylglucosamine 2-epimerase (non-hydrolysing)
MKIAVIFGTRPEAIKLCPVIFALRQRKDIRVSVCVTGQHRKMLDDVLTTFNIIPDIDLDVMHKNQSLAEITSAVLNSVDVYLKQEKPDVVLVQGDTTTAFTASLAAFYNKISVGHVEAGLRTGNKFSPYPEEINRVIITRLADYHFVPTELSKDNLVQEGVKPNKIFLTGNTVIDALLFFTKEVEENPPFELKELLNCLKEKRTILITGHRRESFGRGFEDICEAISELAAEFYDVNFVYPVHLNPNVQEPVFRILSGRKNIFLIEPLSYLPFLALMQRSYFILTDSGGVQEEAPTLGKPILVMRNTTERPEGVEAGAAKLIGTNKSSIIENVRLLLKSNEEYQEMASVMNPYGDGKAAERIANIF